MKFRVSMKDPDTLGDAIAAAVLREVEELPLDNVEKALVAEERRAKVREACQRWFKYGEYLTVDVDTDDMTCTVVHAS